MVFLNSKIDSALNDLIREWNTAERRIKMAEQLRGAEIIASAIFELRYAGRKVIDALDLALHEDQTGDDVSERVYAFILDAIEDCVQANYGAVDAAISFITIWLYENERKLGVRRISKIFPDYLSVTAQISNIQDKISQAREHRGERQRIYENIISTQWEEIISFFDRIRRSDERMLAAVGREKRRDVLISVISAGAGLVAGLGGALVALIR